MSIRTSICRAASRLGFPRAALFTVLLLTQLPSAFADFAQSWAWRNPMPQGNPLLDIAYGNATFVAVGDAGCIVSSPNGVSWTSRNSHTSSPINGIVWGGAAFVAVGEAGLILSSPDGVAWTTRSAGVAASLNAVSYASGQFVAVGDSGAILTSPDGITWTSRSSGSCHRSFRHCSQ